jgi:MFS family permease
LENAPDQKLPGLGKSFYFLFTANLLASVTGFFVVLIRSILMNNLKFSPLEISSTGAIGGLISMPFPFLMGWLSDRIGRKSFLFLGYLATFASILLLAFSNALWNFWLVLTLQGIATGSSGIGNALVTDLVQRESVGKGLAVFGSSAWIGGVIGFAIAGYILQNLGFIPTFVIGGCLALISIGLLIPIQARSRKIEQPHNANP